MSTPATTTAAAPAPPSRWLHGPVSDLLLGCGALYFVFFLAQSLAGDAMRGLLPMALAPLITLAVSVPHYGATLLRVMERPADRRTYGRATTWTTVTALVALFVGLRVPLLGAWIVTLYLTWSPWHYSGQNYGIGMMFLHRRGVQVSPVAQRLYKWSFWLAFVLAILAIHGPSPIAEYSAPGLAAADFNFKPLGIPVGIRDALFIGFGAAYVVTVVLSFVHLRRGAVGCERGALLPAFAIVATQALWFVAPAIVRRWDLLPSIEPLSRDEPAYSFLWVAVGHALQYLWITTYFAERSGAAPSRVRYLGKAMTAGIVAWALPALVFAPGLLGDVPFDAGLGILVASVVNLHHFVIDGVIWKLRKGRIARVLLRRATPEEQPSDSTPPTESPHSPARRWAWPALGALGALLAAASAFSVVEEQIGFQRSLDAQPPRYERARVASERLRWFGRESAQRETRLGMAALALRRPDEAERAFVRAVEIDPSVVAWLGLGVLRRTRRDASGARAAFDAALKIDARHPAALLCAAQLDVAEGHTTSATERLRAAIREADVRRDIPEDKRRNVARTAQRLLMTLDAR